MGRIAFASLLLASCLLALAGAANAQSDNPPLIKIAFVGDSMADGLWGAMFRRIGRDKCLSPRIKLLRLAKNGTGLARPDQFNWPDVVEGLADDQNPDLFVGSFGINDRQAIVEPDRTRTEYGGDAFDAKYEQLVEDLVRSAISHGGSLILMGLPVMQDADVSADAADKNTLFAKGVEKVASPFADYVAPWTSQPPPDIFKPYLRDARNVMTQVRAADGIHFTTVGYDMVGEVLYPAIVASLKKRGRSIDVECAQRAESK